MISAHKQSTPSIRKACIGEQVLTLFGQAVFKWIWKTKIANPMQVHSQEKSSGKLSSDG